MLSGAERVKYAQALGDTDETVAIAALATEVWMLAVAATLTDGSLPVDRIRMAQESIESQSVKQAA